MGVDLAPMQVIGEGILGIQGDSRTGKTSTGFALEPLLGAKVFETSNAFRGFTVWAQRLGVHHLDRGAAQELAADFTFEVTDGRVLVSGMDVTDDLRSQETNRQVAHFAGYERVRMQYVKAMLTWIDVRPAIVIGRHIREVYPYAQLVLESVRRDDVIHDLVAKHEGIDSREVTDARSAKDRENAKLALATISDEYVVLDSTGLSRIQQRDNALHEALKAGFKLAPGRMATVPWVQ